MLTKSSSRCHAICICCSVSKLEFCLGLQRKLSLLSSRGRHKAWDEAAGSLWIGFAGRVLHGVHLGLKKEKTCLKPFPRVNTMKHRSDLWAAVLPLALALAMPRLGAGAAHCSAWSFLCLHSSRKELAVQTCFSLS